MTCPAYATVAIMLSLSLLRPPDDRQVTRST